MTSAMRTASGHALSWTSSSTAKDSTRIAGRRLHAAGFADFRELSTDGVGHAVECSSAKLWIQLP